MKRLSTFDWTSLKEFVGENYPILSLLIGFLLLAFSVGPFTNSDTEWEFNAVSGITQSGLPYANGALINQPPAGFYIQALFSKIVGLTAANGVFLVTLFGTGSVFLMYALGKAVYNKTTGFFAAALFAFSPWQIILSRSFLIDAQCLFFSLLFLVLSIRTIHKDSTRWFLLSGIVFAAAFNTKIYAVFALIPFLILYFARKHLSLKKSLIQLSVFLIPVVASTALWYQVVTSQGIMSILQHWDLSAPNMPSVVPSNLFVLNFLVNYGVGWFFLDAAVMSLLVYVAWRRFFGKQFVFDFICLAVILCVVGVNTFLGAYLNLFAPYLGAIKYDYQALPFLSLLAASLVLKAIMLFSRSQPRKRLRIMYSIVAGAGLLLVMLAMFSNVRYIESMPTWTYVIFRVQPQVNLGYAISAPTAVTGGNLLLASQILGIAVAMSGIVWVSMYRVVTSVKSARVFLMLSLANHRQPKSVLKKRAVEPKDA